MKRTVFFLFLSLIFFAGCQRHDVIQSHGISYLEKRSKLIAENKSNKNDIIKVLGHPSTTGMLNDNLWIYIERTKTKGKLLKLGRNYLKKNNVLVLEFSNYGILEKKKLYNKEDMNKVAFVEGKTENEIKKENFIYSFLSSVRKKMEAKKK